METYHDPLDHLLDHMAVLELRLARHVAALRASGRFVEDPFRGLFVSDAQIDALLAARAREGAWVASAGGLDAAIERRTAELSGRAAASAQLDLPLLRLQRCFGLNEIEIAGLVAAAAGAFDSRFEILFAYAQNDATRRQPTVGLLLDLYAAGPKQRRDGLLRFSPSAPLRAFRLLAPAVGGGDALAYPLALDRPVLPLLLRGDAELLDDALTLQPDPQPASRCDIVAPAREALVRQLAALSGRPVVVMLEGPPDSGQFQVAREHAAAASMRLAVLDLANPAATGLDDESLAAGAGRALRLADAALFVDTGSEAVDRARLARLIARALRTDRPVFLAGAQAAETLVLPPGATAAEVTFPRLTESMRRAWWRTALAGEGIADEAVAAALSRTTRLGPSATAPAIARARLLSPAWPPPDHRPLVAAARRQAGPTLARLAQPVESRWSWDDLVLPAEQRDELQVLAAAVVQGPRIAADWGFETRGLPNALVALFSGPSGTGKTMAAGLIAARAGVPLYRADLSAIVSKYIGETEKQLDRVLREAETIGAALLFDEADALFGKRAEVKDARDRYANQEVAFLLQRIEAFDGLVILTTNLSGHIDQAFLRRIAYAVHFPMPDEGLRAELWRRAFPRDAPLDPDLDLHELARAFEIAGGNIRNVALGAAHLAASEDRAIAMRDVVRCVAREIRKLGRLPSRAEFGPLYAALTPPARLS